MQENAKKKDNQDFYTAQFIPNKSRFDKKHRREHCIAHHNQITTIGRHKGQQVRIETPTANKPTLALYTIIGVHNEEPDAVYVGYSDSNKPWERLELAGTDSLTGDVKAQVAAVGLTDAEAEIQEEFIEHLTDDGNNSRLAIIAPHGGDIEKHTDEQAENVAKQLSSNYVSTWICKGFKAHGAYNRWHITSTDISEESFPKLKTIIGRHFEYCIAFHGWNNENSICIGGGRNSSRLKKQIKTEIENAVSGSQIKVSTDEDRYGTCTQDFNDSDPDNIVNRLSDLSAKGVQIEQSIEAREGHDQHGCSLAIRIADAVADVMRPIIQV